MENLISRSNKDPNTKQDAWYKIIEDFQTSGQSQVNYCKQRNLNKDHFAYYITKLRKQNSNVKSPVSFIKMQVIDPIQQPKWILNIVDGIKLEVPHAVSMNQLAELLLKLRASIC